MGRRQLSLVAAGVRERSGTEGHGDDGVRHNGFDTNRKVIARPRPFLEATRV